MQDGYEVTLNANTPAGRLALILYGHAIGDEEIVRMAVSTRCPGYRWHTLPAFGSDPVETVAMVMRMYGLTAAQADLLEQQAKANSDTEPYFLVLKDKTADRRQARKRIKRFGEILREIEPAAVT